MSETLGIMRVNNGVTTINSFSATECDFDLFNCTPTSNELFLKLEGDQWNCNLCQSDRVFFTPVDDGYPFHIQTQFLDQYNTDPAAPTDGWGTWMTAKLYDSEGNLISSDYTTFASNWVIGWSGEHSYQILEIDPGAAIFAGVDCFQIVLESNILAGGLEELVTEQFKFLEACDKSVRLESGYPEIDCFNNYYAIPEVWLGSGDTPLLYSNRIIVKGELVDTGASYEKTISNNRVQSVDVRNFVRLYHADPWPPFMKNIISRQILPGSNILANEEPYELDTFSVVNLLTDTNMFIFYVDLQEVCELDYKCHGTTREGDANLIPPVVSGCVGCTPAITCIGG